MKTFLNSSIDKEKHSSMIFLHTGSICYDALAFVIWLIANMTLNDNNGVKEVQNIQKGDIVSYKGKRWRFDGEVIIDGVTRYSLNDGKKYATTIKISKEALGSLIPYKGKAKKLEGIGGMSSDMLQSPTDPEATFREKAGKQYCSYVGNIEESVDENGFVVTGYGYKTNNARDSDILRDYLEKTGVQETLFAADGA